MKNRQIFVLIGAFLIMGLAGCGAPSAADPAANPPSETVAGAEPDAPVSTEALSPTESLAEEETASEEQPTVDVAQSEPAPPEEAAHPPAALSLAEGEFYVIRATGAVESTYVGRQWGSRPQKQLYDTGIGTYKLLMSGTGNADTPEIQLIHLGIVQGLAPGTYALSEGTLLSQPDAETPVMVTGVAVNYSDDFDILNDGDEVDGTITFDTISAAGMSGAISATLYGESGTVELNALFDVPVVEQFQP